MIFNTQDQYKKQVTDIGYTKLHRVKSAESSEVIRYYESGNKVIQISQSEGYKSVITVLVVIEDNNITDVKILSHHETEDYGGYITEEWFLNRFLQKIGDKFKVVKIKKTKENEIVAVTGATVSSRAVVNAVNKCVENYGGK